MKSDERWEGLQLRRTEDGSFTLDIPGMKESYHSLHGAVQESFHVFIEMGLKAVEKEGTIDILEIGWGTGLNSLTTAKSMRQPVNYTAIEAFPVPIDLAQKMAYWQDPGLHGMEAFFAATHLAEWNKPIAINDAFTLTKIEADIHQHLFPEQTFDLVYFDAFAPRAQADMWKPEVLHNVVSALRKGGILVTYCSQGQFRRDLASCGMEVTKVDGPPGKRDMVRAYKL